jgi:hypothetical protein
MPTWETILAALLFLQAPGKTIYSTMPVAEGSAPSITAEVNGTTAYRLLAPEEEPPNQCSQPGNVACYKPRKRDVVLQLRPVRTEWQRTETYDEGVKRYAIIAKAMAEVLGNGEWSFPPGQSWQFLASIAYHESGFRRDIHTGYGAWAIGDCSWRTVKKDEHGFSKKRVRIPGTCKSHGLFQTLFRNPKQTKIFGFGARDVVGDDLASTKTAVTVAAKHLDRLHGWCTKRGPRPFAYCMFASYGGIIHRGDKRVGSRLRTLNKLKGAPVELDSYVRNVLGLPKKDEPLAALSNSGGSAAP